MENEILGSIDKKLNIIIGLLAGKVIKGKNKTEGNYTLRASTQHE